MLKLDTLTAKMLIETTQSVCMTYIRFLVTASVTCE